MGKIKIAPIVGMFALTLTSAGALSRVQSQASPADELVRQLGQFPAAVGGGIPRKDGSRDEVEDRRRAVYLQLRGLGQEALPALARGLADEDVQIRRNTALFLGAMGGGWYDSSQPRLDIHACLGALTSALRDRDARVRQLAAAAIGAIGPRAVSAVPALIILLMDPGPDPIRWSPPGRVLVLKKRSAALASSSEGNRLQYFGSLSNTFRLRNVYIVAQNTVAASCC